MAYSPWIFKKSDLEDTYTVLKLSNPNLKKPKFPVFQMRQLFNIFKKDVVEQYADDYGISRDKISPKDVSLAYIEQAKFSFAEALILDRSMDFSDYGSIWLAAAKSALKGFERIRQKEEYEDALSLIRDNKFQFQVGALVDKILRVGLDAGDDYIYTAPSSKFYEMNSSGDLDFGVVTPWEEAPEDARQALIAYADAIKRHGVDTEGISSMVYDEAYKAAKELAKWYGIKTPKFDDINEDTSSSAFV